ncbi:DUF441 domain-containing protein [Levilactobacillus brevis]|uniref:DUF441 domain-containing protein n=1 Tax=Levilactobacillus brevis TaxID=1580 RepID=UPI002072C800|nr:DUF441 domain-containing protein [Levilactobacillus brevis]
MESGFFLLIILAISIVSKNKSLIIGVSAVIVLRMIPQTQSLLKLLQAQGINWGVTVISAAIMVPIATGEIGFKDLLNVIKSPAGWIAISCGILVAILSAKGIGLLTMRPEMTVALVFGTIIGVVFLKGIAAGPVIASGLTYVILTIFNLVPGH